MRFSAPSWTAPRLYLRRVVTGVGRHRAFFVPRSAMLVITALACGFAEGANNACACPLALLLTFPTQGGLLRARSSRILARCAFVCSLLFYYIASGKTRGSPYSSLSRVKRQRRRGRGTIERADVACEQGASHLRRAGRLQGLPATVLIVYQGLQQCNAESRGGGDSLYCSGGSLGIWRLRCASIILLCWAMLG